MNLVLKNITTVSEPSTFTLDPEPDEYVDWYETGTEYDG